MRTTNDPYVITNSAVFINYCILNCTATAYSQLWNTMLLVQGYVIQRFVIITTHNVGVDQTGIMAYSGTNSNHAIFNEGCIYNTTVGKNAVVEPGATYFSGRQHTGPC